MVVLHQVAESGGGTTFSKAGVYVKPRRNQAVFFSYRDEYGRMEMELTEHSGCPVKEGEKWVMTLWLRDGVSTSDSWVLYDPTGSRLSKS